MVTVALDTNVIVALVDDRDTWHGTAVTMRDALLEIHAQMVYFDCVFNETIGVIGRRTAEQKRPEQFDRLHAFVRLSSYPKLHGYVSLEPLAV
jgi:predicted nucleic acid-binding protein